MAVQHRDVASRSAGIVRIVRPCVDLPCGRMAAQLDYLHHPIPNRFTSECLFDRHALDVLRGRAVEASDHLAQLIEVFGHAVATSTSRLTDHCDDATPAAIAGVQRNVMWRFTRL